MSLRRARETGERGSIGGVNRNFRPKRKFGAGGSCFKQAKVGCCQLGALLILLIQLQADFGAQLADATGQPAAALVSISAATATQTGSPLGLSVREEPKSSSNSDSSVSLSGSPEAATVLPLEASERTRGRRIDQIGGWQRLRTEMGAMRSNFRPGEDWSGPAKQLLLQLLGQTKRASELQGSRWTVVPTETHTTTTTTTATTTIPRRPPLFSFNRQRLPQTRQPPSSSSSSSSSSNLSNLLNGNRRGPQQQNGSEGSLLRRALDSFNRRIGARNSIRVHNAFRDLAWRILSSLSMPTPVIYELRRQNFYSLEDDLANDALHDKNTSRSVRVRRQFGPQAPLQHPFPLTSRLPNIGQPTWEAGDRLAQAQIGGDNASPLAGLQVRKFVIERSQDRGDSNNNHWKLQEAKPSARQTEESELRQRLRLRLDNLLSLSQRSLFGRVVRVPAIFPFRKRQANESRGDESGVARPKDRKLATRNRRRFLGRRRRRKEDDQQLIFVNGKQYYIDDDGQLKPSKTEDSQNEDEEPSAEH